MPRLRAEGWTPPPGRMRLCTAALLLLLAICLPPGHGILETHYTNLKCRCSKVSSTFINLILVDWIQVIRPGNGCPKTEIIFWTKAKKAICVNPTARWLPKVLKFVRSRSITSTPQAPVSKKRAAWSHCHPKRHLHPFLIPARNFSVKFLVEEFPRK